MKRIGWLWLVGYLGTIVLANWLLQTYGVVTVLGLSAPAGVFAVGLALTCRDFAHRSLGHRWPIYAAIVAGAALSWYLTDDFTVPGGWLSLAWASGIAFAFSEAADTEVWLRVRERWGEWWAVGISNAFGAAADSLLFLVLAFGSIDLFWGQWIGKMAITVAFLAPWWVWRWRQAPRVGLAH